MACETKDRAQVLVVSRELVVDVACSCVRRRRSDNRLQHNTHSCTMDQVEELSVECLRDAVSEVTTASQDVPGFGRPMPIGSAHIHTLQ